MHKAKNQLLTINHVVSGYAKRENGKELKSDRDKWEI
jgi:hypothetical protein